MPATVFELYFEDFHPGWTFEQGARTLSAADIKAFAREWDPQRYHTDEEQARASPYGGLIASGWQIASLSFRLFWQSGFIYGGSLGSPGIQDLRWLKPVRPGDTIFVEAEVTSTRLSSKGDRGYVGVSYAAKNQKGETVLTMAGTQIMALRPSRDPRPKTKAAKVK